MTNYLRDVGCKMLPNITQMASSEYTQYSNLTRTRDNDTALPKGVIICKRQYHVVKYTVYFCLFEYVACLKFELLRY